MALPSKITPAIFSTGYGIQDNGSIVSENHAVYSDADIQRAVSVLNDVIGELNSGTGLITTALLSSAATPTAKAIVAAASAAIPVTGNGNLALTIADAAETNTLAVPTFAGQILAISADTVAGSGSRAVTVASAINATGNNTITLDAAGEFIVLYGIKLGATFAWRVLATDGATLSTVG